MKRLTFTGARNYVLIGVLGGMVVAITFIPHRPAFPSQDQQGARKQEPEASSLKAELEAVKSLLPDQAHAMADVGHHFSHLWLAAEKKNWALAAFYLGETRSHLKWAVRIKPLRKNSAGQDVNLVGILEAVDNSFLAELEKLIAAKDGEKFAAAYRLTLEGCYSCHKASEKPYLRLQIPEGREGQIINFDPDAAWPQ